MFLFFNSDFNADSVFCTLDFARRIAEISDFETAENADFISASDTRKDEIVAPLNFFSYCRMIYHHFF